jgi:hypothetical protein
MVGSTGGWIDELLDGRISERTFGCMCRWMGG